MDLYQAILSRRSVRRYGSEPLDKDMLAQIDEIVASVRPLVPDNRFRVMRRDVITGEDLIAAMGGYGRILSPPHYLVGYMIGDRAPLVDLGYRLEQVAVHLVQAGISVCFIGSLDREADVRVRFRLNRQARIGAFLIFGRAAETVTGRALNAVIRRAAGSASRMASDEIFYKNSFDKPQAPPRRLAKVIEAARVAPSSQNAQPWRFLWQDPMLYLFVQKRSNRYGSDPDLQAYRFFDAGTCMANITMALASMDAEAQWTLIEDGTLAPPGFPDTLEPIASLLLD